MDDLDQAVRYALAPLTEQAGWELCPYCGATKARLEGHTCRTATLEIPGVESDAKRRAKSYAIS